MNPQVATGEKCLENDDPYVLTEIYSKGTNMAVWERVFPVILQQYARATAFNKPGLQIRIAGSMDVVARELHSDLPELSGKNAFISDLELLVDMYSELFGLREVGFRLAALSSAMCPRFHVDRVPCRLVTTYFGAGTEWLHNGHVQRSEPGCIEVIDTGAIRRLQPGDVALLKGEAWDDNEGRGLVHRSPPASINEPRLVLTLDFI